jgi:hypothetical protein
VRIDSKKKNFCVENVEILDVKEVVHIVMCMVVRATNKMGSSSDDRIW